jgi:ZIP family zinc transporter
VATPTVAFLLAVLAAAATMLGWAAVAAKRSWTPRGVGIALIVSGLAMLGVSLAELLPPGLRDPDARLATITLFALGMLLVPALGWVLGRLIPGLGSLQSASVLVMASIALHNVPEGTVVVAATTVDLELGVVTAIAIALHNIPEGMAVATAVLAAGGSRRASFGFTAVSMLGEVLGAALIVVLGMGLSPAGATAVLALVGGVMVALSLSQLLPAGIGLVRQRDSEQDLDALSGPARR